MVVIGRTRWLYNHCTPFLLSLAIGYIYSRIVIYALCFGMIKLSGLQLNHHFSLNCESQMKCFGIHSKKWIPWILESAENFEFSAERLSENAKTINSAMCVEITVKRHLPCHSSHPLPSHCSSCNKHTS